VPSINTIINVFRPFFNLPKKEDFFHAFSADAFPSVPLTVQSGPPLRFISSFAHPHFTPAKENCPWGEKPPEWRLVGRKENCPREGWIPAAHDRPGAFLVQGGTVRFPARFRPQPFFAPAGGISETILKSPFFLFALLSSC
jgi:hypothetical protein